MKSREASICVLLFIVTLSALIADVCSTDNRAKTDGPMVALTSRQQMPIVINGDTTMVSLAKGDSVRIIGFTRLTYSQSIMVETANGDRGELDASQLPIKQLVIAGKHKGDTIVSMTANYSGRNVSDYTCRTATGQEIKLDGKNFAPILEGWEDYSLNNNSSTAITTQSALKKCQGKTLAELEEMYGAAYNVLTHSDGSKEAGFRVYAYGSDGKPYLPAIAFDSEGGATDFNFNLLKNKANNGWLLGSLPLTGAIIDMSVIRSLTRSDIYSIPSDTGKSTPWYVYILFVVQIVMMLAWYLLTPTLIIALLGILLHIPAIFKILGNGALRVLFIAVAVVSTYIWMIALMAWGMHWIFVVLIIPVMWYCTRTAMRIIDFRCTKCGHLHTIEFDHEVITGTEFVTQPYSQFKGTVDKSSSYDSFSQGITTYWSDGSTTHRTVQRQVKLKHETDSYDDYDVTFLVTHKILYYVCSNCGHTETFKDDVWEEVSRKKTGSHTESTTTVDKIF